MPHSYWYMCYIMSYPSGIRMIIYGFPNHLIFPPYILPYNILSIYLSLRLLNPCIFPPPFAATYSALITSISIVA